MMAHPHPAPAAERIFNVHDLLAEIAWLEGRLQEIEDSGECAYEKALARSFEQAVRQHRARLAVLQAGGT